MTTFDKPDRGKPRRGPPRAKSPAGAGEKPFAKPRARPRGAESAFEGERIAKMMARAGLCSRRDAEEWVRAGRVVVNGTVLADPAVNVTEADRVTVDGQPLAKPEKTRLFLFNKPRGLVTTDHDPEGRPTVFDYLAHHHPDLPRLISIGRLDITTEGLLLLTNDGGLARVLELPATGWMRRYRVRAHGTTTPDAVTALKDGVTIEGVAYQPIEASLDRVQGANVWLTVALREGKNREVRRVLEHLGLEVNRLIRLSYGPFQLGEAPDGAVEEVRTRVLMDQLGPTLIAEANADFSTLRRDEEDAHRRTLDAQAMPPPKRERPVPGKRKHVSVLRTEREEAAGPRVRTERGATADRRGRTVAVERKSAAHPKADAPDTRNGRRFRQERDGAREGGGERGTERPRRFEQRGDARRDEAGPRRGRPGAERPAAGSDHPRATGTSFGARSEGPRGEGPRFAGKRFEGKPPAGKPFGGKPFGGKSFGDKRPDASRPDRGRPEGKRFEGKRADGGSFEKKPFGAKPFGKRPDARSDARPDARPGGSRPGGARPGGSRPGGARPGGSAPGGSKPAGSRPGGSRPGGTKPRGPKPPPA